MNMITRLQQMKKKKGFTLVELIIVLVILGILIALLIPALTGYIQKAQGKKVLAEARMLIMAAQTIGSEHYAKALADGTEFSAADTTVMVGEITPLSEVKGDWAITYNPSAAITKLVYTSGGWSVVYENGVFADPLNNNGGVTAGTHSISFGTTTGGTTP